MNAEGSLPGALAADTRQNLFTCWRRYCESVHWNWRKAPLSSALHLLAMFPLKAFPAVPPEAEEEI